ncbi:hypothetical protein D9M70_640230 [compost metagenome]
MCEIIGFLDRQGVHVRSQHDGTAGVPAGQRGHQAGLGDAPFDGIAVTFQGLGDGVGSEMLFEAQLRPGMKLLAQLAEALDRI